MTNPQESTLFINMETIDEMRQFVLSKSKLITQLINHSRKIYEGIFHQQIKPVTESQVAELTHQLFSSTPLAINLSILLKIAINIQSEFDNWEIVVDEIIGTTIAEIIVKSEPERTWSKATYYIIDLLIKSELDDEFPKTAIALDDAFAGLAAGYQVSLPGWD